MSASPLIPITRKQAFFYAIFLVFYEFLAYIANDLILPAMIHVVHTFHASLSNVPTSLTTYILGGASVQIILGPISDRMGRRPVMLFGVILFLLCTIFISVSVTIEQFLTARFFQGMGLGFIIVVGYATLQEIFAEKEAVRLTALMANVSLMAPLLGPIVGALLIQCVSWRAIFLVIAAGAFLALLGLWRFMPETVGVRRRDGEIMAPASLAPMAILKRYGQLLSNPAFLFNALALGFLWLPCLTWIALSPVLLVKSAHLSLVEYGAWQIPVFSASVVGNFILHRITLRRSLSQLVGIGAFVLTQGLLLLWALPYFLGAYDYFWLMPGIILYFMGSALTNSPLTRLILFSTSVSKGTTSALMSIVAMAIPGIGIEVFNYFDAPFHYLRYAGLCGVSGVGFCVFVYLGLRASHQK